MSFRHLIDEMAANEKHPMWSVFDGLPGLDPRPKKPLRKAIGISAEWTKAFFDAHRRAMSSVSPLKRGEYSAMIKAIREEQAVELEAMRKADSIYQHHQMVLKHALLGQKITDACRRGTVSALEGATLEQKWNAHGDILNAQAKRLGLRS